MHNLEVAGRNGWNYISLAKMLGNLEIKDILGSIDASDGVPVFSPSYLLLSDGSMIDFEGEHDCPYLGSSTNEAINQLLSEDNMAQLDEEIMALYKTNEYE